MSKARRPVTVALCGVVALGLMAVAIDATTIRLQAGTDFAHPVTVIAFPGELVSVEVAGRWTPVKTTNPEVIEPLGANRFIAAGLGTAVLSSVSSPPPGQYYATLMWRATIEVRLLGT